MTNAGKGGKKGGKFAKEEKGSIPDNYSDGYEKWLSKI